MLDNKKYHRIIVLGAGGSGKTTLSKKLSKKLNIELIHLDKEYWLPSWQKPDLNTWKEKVSTLVQKECWIMDGNYIETLDLRLEKADLVIMLDIDSSICTRSIMLRTIKSYFTKRTDLIDGCSDRFNKEYHEFVKWAKAFKKEYFPSLLNLCLKYKDVDLMIFKTRKNAKKFIERIMIDEKN